MKYIYFFVFFIFSGILLAQNGFLQPIDSVIPWKSTARLTWDDFQGEKKFSKFASAATSYKIDIFPLEVMVDEKGNIQDYEKLTVRAQFYKRHSWTSTESIFLLEHEQLHFDIAELFARKIKKRFAELKSAKESRFSKYQENYSLIWNQCRKYQKQYDLETKHGQNLASNQKWEQLISLELKALEAFK